MVANSERVQGKGGGCHCKHFRRCRDGHGAFLDEFVSALSLLNFWMKTGNRVIDGEFLLSRHPFDIGYSDVLHKWELQIPLASL